MKEDYKYVVSKICKFCKKEYLADKYKNFGFCSISCANDYRYRKEKRVTNCGQCGKEIKTTKRYLSLYKILYCDKKCQNEHYKTRFNREDNPNYKNGGIKICLRCGKEFKSYMKYRKYCSLKCRTPKLFKICKNCNQEFLIRKRRQVFCNNTCFRQYIQKIGTEIKICLMCKKEFRIRKSLYNSKYCSYDCSGESKKELFKGKGNPRWEGGTITYRGEDWNESRRKAYERDKGTCQCCGEQEKRINAHHIIPWRISHNNELKNLICLCNSCHTTEENYYRQFGRPSKKMLD